MKKIALIFLTALIATGFDAEAQDVEIVNLGAKINSSAEDYAPALSPDEKTLYFISNREGSRIGENGEPSHDFWAVDIIRNGHEIEFSKPYNVDPGGIHGDEGLNTKHNEGVGSIASDNKTIYFTACDRPNSAGSCDLYKVVKDGDQWGEALFLGAVNRGSWDAQPSMHPNGNRLFFSSNRRGPRGQSKDIWYSDYDSDWEEWGEAVNLENINTDGDEVSPYISSDGQTLIFASDGRESSFGGFDFYYCIYDKDDKSWSSPENLGKPLNTEDDETFITMTRDGGIIFFSSKRQDVDGYQGGMDIFMAIVKE